MKKLHFLCLASLVILGWSAQGDALPIKLEGSSTRIFSNRQPVEVVIIDSNGHIYHQTIPYDLAIGGVDINLGQIGPHASIYFPDLGIGYIWYNGQWVNEEGYYWDGRNRVDIKDPNWKKYWVHYWQGNQYEKVRKGPWHQRTFDGRPRNNVQYGNEGNEGYDTYRQGEFDNRQRGRWPERREFDERSQRNWREERGGFNRPSQQNRGQGNWEGQGYSHESSWNNRMPGKGWENQPSTSSRNTPPSATETRESVNKNSATNSRNGPPSSNRDGQLSWWDGASMGGSRDRPKKASRWERQSDPQAPQQ